MDIMYPRMVELKCLGYRGTGVFWGGNDIMGNEVLEVSIYVCNIF